MKVADCKAGFAAREEERRAEVPSLREDAMADGPKTEGREEVLIWGLEGG